MKKVIELLEKVESLTPESKASVRLLLVGMIQEAYKEGYKEGYKDGSERALEIIETINDDPEDEAYNKASSNAGVLI